MLIAQMYDLVENDRTLIEKWMEVIFYCLCQAILTKNLGIRCVSVCSVTVDRGAERKLLVCGF